MGILVGGECGASVPGLLGVVKELHDALRCGLADQIAAGDVLGCIDPVCFTSKGGVGAPVVGGMHDDGGRAGGAPGQEARSCPMTPAVARIVTRRLVVSDGVDGEGHAAPRVSAVGGACRTGGMAMH